MDKNVWRILGIIFTILTVLFIVLIIVLPIVRKNSTESECSEKSTPKRNNIKLWAEFPGELNTITNHILKVLDYSDDFNNYTIKDSISLTEEIKYENFNYSESEDKLYFDAKSKYKINSPKKTKNEKIRTLNLGLFETLETISNPPIYQRGVNSIKYLLNKAFQNPDSFIRLLFSYYFSKNFLNNQTLVKETILKDVESSKVDKILSPDSEYSFIKVSGFYQWIKILGIPYSITKANWLRDIFELTESETNSILDKEHYLYEQYSYFNRNLSTAYKCKDENFCGYEILYNQLISGKVIIDKTGGDLKSLKELYDKIKPELYPFKKSPELNIYFEEYKIRKNNLGLKYENYIVNETQLERLINPESKYTLLSSNNSALFLTLYKLKDEKLSLEIFELNLSQLEFFYYYFYAFLPKLFLYQDFEESNINYSINPISKAFATIAQNIVEQTYYQLSSHNGIYNLILGKLVWEGLINKLSNIGMELRDEDICPFIMQRALDDGKKVLKICSNPQTLFNSPYTLSKWFAPYNCIKSGDESKCDMNTINNLKKIVYITNDEIKAIYDMNFLGGVIEEKDKVLKEAYKCENECDNDYLAKMQFWKSYVTKNVPEGLEKCDSISEMFPDEFPYPVELSYYTSVEIQEKDVDYLISLSPKGDDLLEEDSYEAFNRRIDLEKNFTLYMEKKKINNESIFNLIGNFTEGYLYKNTSTNYEKLDNLLQGNIDEDLRFIRYLSKGKFYDNFKPGYNKTTGVNFGINLETGEEIYVEFDRYAINTKDNMLRRIISINDCPLLNIKKKEYNYLSNTYSAINSPILNFSLNDELLVDGFQYSHEQDSIYYYDKISSRQLKFSFFEEVDYYEQVCRKYTLDESNLNSEKAFISEKLNKPFFITAGKYGLNDELKKNISDENYICLEPFSNLVLDSKINLVYSLYTGKFGYLYPKIENEKVYPIFFYSKSYEVDKESFENAFPEINSYRKFRFVFIIVGIILIVLFCAIATYCFYKVIKYRRPRFSIYKGNNGNEKQQKLINDSTTESRDPTVFGKKEDDNDN